MKCEFCKWFYESNVVSKGARAFERKCIASFEKVNVNSNACKYFNPATFFCDKAKYRINFTQCLNRRRNEKKIQKYLSCKKCRQWSQSIKKVIEKYYIDMEPIVTPRHLVSSEENEDTNSDKRKIKRRKRNEERTIKRRKRK